MPKTVTFQVSKRNGPSVEVTFDEPESITDERWNDLVNDTDADINTLALKALRVAIQAGAREELENGEEAVQNYVNTYKYRSGGTRSAKAKPISKDLQKKAKFSKEQLAALAAAGFSVEG